MFQGNIVAHQLIDEAKKKKARNIIHFVILSIQTKILTRIYNFLSLSYVTRSLRIHPNTISITASKEIYLPATRIQRYSEFREKRKKKKERKKERKKKKEISCLGTRNRHLQSWEHGLEMLEPCIFLSLPGLLYLHLFSFQPLPPFSAIFRQRVPASTYISARARARFPLSIYCGATEAGQRERERKRERNGAREKEGTKSKLGGGKARRKGEKANPKGVSRRVEFAGRVQPPSSSTHPMNRVYFCGQLFLCGLVGYSSSHAHGPELGQWRGHHREPPTLLLSLFSFSLSFFFLLFFSFFFFLSYFFFTSNKLDLREWTVNWRVCVWRVSKKGYC